MGLSPFTSKDFVFSGYLRLAPIKGGSMIAWFDMINPQKYKKNLQKPHIAAENHPFSMGKSTISMAMLSIAMKQMKPVDQVG